MLVVGRSLCQPSGAFNFSSLCCPADAGAAAGVPLFDTTTGAEPQPFATTAAINTAQVFRKLDWSMINDRLLQIIRKKIKRPALVLVSDLRRRVRSSAQSKTSEACHSWNQTKSGPIHR